MKKKILSMSLILVMLFTITGCGEVAKLENGQEAVVKFGEDTGISADELYTELTKNSAIAILVDMIDKKILDEHYPLTEEQEETVDQQIEDLKLQVGGDVLTFNSTIQQYYGVDNEEALKEVFLLDHRRGVAIEDYIKKSITDSDVENYYNDEIIGDIKASHILIKPNVVDGMTEDEIATAEAEALQEAKDIITRLNDGESFEDLAKELSEDEGTAVNGGNLGFFNKNGELEDPFVESAMTLEKDAYTKEPVKTTYGYHIILKTDEKEKVELDEIKDEIIDTIMNNKILEDVELQYKTLMDIRNDNGMTFEDSNLKEQYDEFMEDLLDTVREQNAA